MRENQLAVGQLRRQRRLDSEAIYRICDCSDALVEVEVVLAPGLAAAQRFRFTRADVLAMELVAPDASPPRSGEPPG